MGVLKDMWFYMFNQISAVTLFDILDIAIVSVVFYYVFKFVRDRRAGKLAIGIIVILVMLFLSETLNMHALNFLLQNIVQVGIIGLVIVFQTELRTFLEKMGGNSIISGLNKKNGGSNQVTMRCIESVVEACVAFSEEKTGALIVFERSTKLGDVIKTGTVINADPDAFLIKNIFYDKAPLHDGAMVIRNNRLHAAGCFLPLSSSDNIIKDLGTRHRAAIGMSENSDAAVIVVSEESGVISVAHDGKLKRNLDHASLRKELVKYMLEAEEKSKRFRKKKKKKTAEDPASGMDETTV